jgi:poly(hydroxyalkanoate) depolymerase family esterase
MSSIATTLRRSRRKKRPIGPTKATRSFQKSMTALILKSALAPMNTLTTNMAKARKAGVRKAGQTLGAVVGQLHAAQSMGSGAMLRPAGPKALPRIPAGAQYLSRRHRCASGVRAFKLYVPTARPGGLILMLHGCDQTPDDFALGTGMNALAEKHGLAIAWPAQTRGNNPASCWNWFRPGDQARGAGEPALLASLTRKLMREFGLGRDATFVAGLSAGGAMAAILADVYPDVFSASGVHSGLARGAAHDVVSAMSAMRSGGSKRVVSAAKAGPDTVRRIVFHGDADGTVHASNAPMIVAAAIGDGAVPTRTCKRSVRGRGYVRSDFAGPDGVVRLELWMLWTGPGMPGRAAALRVPIPTPRAPTPRPK